MKMNPRLIQLILTAHTRKHRLVERSRVHQHTYYAASALRFAVTGGMYVCF